MKTKFLLSLLSLVIFISMLNAQTLSGVYKNSGLSTGSYYTDVKWQVSYTFEEDERLVYIRFFNPKISVPNYSKYNFYGEIYSLSDIGLSSWPQSNQLPYAMQVAVTVTDGYNNYDVSGFCDANGTCDRTYIIDKVNVKNYSLSHFNVPSGYNSFHANLGGEGETEDLIKSKKESEKKSQEKKSQKNESVNSSTADSGTSASPSSSSSTSSSSSSSESEATVYNNIFLAEAARKQQEEKAYQDVVKGVFDLFTPSAEESERKSREYVQKMEYKAVLDKSLESKIEAAKNGDDQSYYDIYLAYQYSFPSDARYYRKLAYSTGNASLFKAEKKLERKSPKAMFIGYQYGEISPYGLSFFQTTDNFGFFMLFRLSDKAFTTYTEREAVSKNRDVYTTGNGTTYTYLSEATKQEQGKFMLSLGTSYHVYKPLFIYAGVGFALVNTFSNQRMVEYNKPEVLQIDESYYGASTDVGLLIKLGRRIAINGGVSFVNLKNPEYTGGISFNFWPEK